MRASILCFPFFTHQSILVYLKSILIHKLIPIPIITTTSSHTTSFMELYRPFLSSSHFFFLFWNGVWDGCRAGVSATSGLWSEGVYMRSESDAGAGKLSSMFVSLLSRMPRFVWIGSGWCWVHPGSSASVASRMLLHPTSRIPSRAPLTYRWPQVFHCIFILSLHFRSSFSFCSVLEAPRHRNASRGSTLL